MSSLPRIRIRTRMTGRDIHEPHRVSSPLELLFDLTFVVAVAQIAVQLAHKISDGHALDQGIGAYLMVFFAIWWAWLNFTWFASAFDTDDVPYRLMTMVLMAGVLVLAAGVPAAFNNQDYSGITLGYFIMRLGAVAQWVRAGVEDPVQRPTAFRYAGAITVVQLGWILRLLLPGDAGVWSFILLAVAEVCVPLFAERRLATPWHPHHIAERYGLFTIILLGESVSAVTIAVQASISSRGVSASLVVIAFSGLVLLFALWWLYFLEPAGKGLSEHRSRSYLWGYGHYVLFAAIAAMGAALEVAVESGGEHSEIGPVAVGYALAIPVAVFFVTLFAIRSAVRTLLTSGPVALGVAAVAVLLIPLAAAEIGVAATIAAIALVAAVTTGVSILDNARRSAVLSAQ